MVYGMCVLSHSTQILLIYTSNMAIPHTANLEFYFPLYFFPLGKKYKRQNYIFNENPFAMGTGLLLRGGKSGDLIAIFISMHREAPRNTRKACSSPNSKYNHKYSHNTRTIPQLYTNHSQYIHTVVDIVGFLSKKNLNMSSISCVIKTSDRDSFPIY